MVNDKIQYDDDYGFNYNSLNEDEIDSDDIDDEDGSSYDDPESRRLHRSSGLHEMPQGSRTNYKGHWSKEEVSSNFLKKAFYSSFILIILNLNINVLNFRICTLQMQLKDMEERIGRKLLKISLDVLTSNVFIDGKKF